MKFGTYRDNLLWRNAANSVRFSEHDSNAELPDLARRLLRDLLKPKILLIDDKLPHCV